MFFKNLILYRLHEGCTIDADTLSQQLSALPFRACSASEKSTVGWIPPRPHCQLAHSVGGHILIALKQETKLLPTSVVKRFAKERAEKIEEESGRRVGRKEMRELQEQVADELISRAFSSERTTFAWINPSQGWLAVDATSPARAEALIECLHRSVTGLRIAVPKLAQSPSASMTGWVAETEAPAGFTIDQDLELCSADKGKVRYTQHTLDGEEIPQHIASGKIVSRLALTWADKVSFLLTDQFALRRLSFLDILKDEAASHAESAEEQFDADFTLMAGELSRLLTELVEAVGGEQPAP